MTGVICLKASLYSISMSWEFGLRPQTIHVVRAWFCLPNDEWGASLFFKSVCIPRLSNAAIKDPLPAVYILKLSEIFLFPTRKGIKDEHLHTGCGEGSDVCSGIACWKRKIQFSPYSPSGLNTHRDAHKTATVYALVLSWEGSGIGYLSWWESCISALHSYSRDPTMSSLSFYLYLLAWEPFLLYPRRTQHPVIACSKPAVKVTLFFPLYFEDLNYCLYWHILIVHHGGLYKDILSYVYHGLWPYSYSYILFFFHLSPKLLFFFPDSLAFAIMKSTPLKLYLYHLYPSLYINDCI